MEVWTRRELSWQKGESGWGGGRHRLNEFDDQNYHGFTITRHDYHENNMG